MSNPAWYRSLYWRIGAGFVLFLALIASVQAGALVWLTSRVEYGPTSPSATRVVADELSRELTANPKLDLAQFYARIAGQILPWMKGRPVAMERCPDRIRASCVYQKRAPHNLPGEVPTVTIPAISSGAKIDYVRSTVRLTAFLELLILAPSGLNEKRSLTQISSRKNPRFHSWSQTVWSMP